MPAHEIHHKNNKTIISRYYETNSPPQNDPKSDFGQMKKIKSLIEKDTKLKVGRIELREKLK